MFVFARRFAARADRRGWAACSLLTGLVIAASIAGAFNSALLQSRTEKKNDINTLERPRLMSPSDIANMKTEEADADPVSKSTLQNQVSASSAVFVKVP